MTERNLHVLAPSAGIGLGATAPRLRIVNNVKLASVLPATRTHGSVRHAPRSRPQRRPSRRARAPARSTDEPHHVRPASGRATPHLTPEDAVIDAIRLGRRAILNLTVAQRSALDDPEGRQSLWILEHILLARLRTGQPRELPLTEQFVLRAARRLGLPQSRNAARRVSRRLAGAGIIVPFDFYRQKYASSAPRGFRVLLWSVQPISLADGRPRSFAEPRQPRSATPTASVAARRKVKSRAWWTHPLFGNPDRRPPPALWHRKRELWLSRGHRREEELREAEYWEAG